MIKVAVLYICIGKYKLFWKNFYLNMEKYFLLSSQKEYFVFTDAEELYAEQNCSHIHRIYQEDLGWPGNTLFRFDMFSRVIDALKNFDYIVFLNANVICNRVITEEEFLPIEKDLLFVTHPGYYAKMPYEFPYDRNRKCRAYIPYSKGNVYICGGINGGKACAYIALINKLKENISKDYSEGVVANWHDESHLNRYYLENSEDCRLLTPSFCYNEEGNYPYEPVLLVLDKKKWITLDKDKVERQQRRVTVTEKIKRIIVKIIWGTYYHFK